MAVEFMSAHRIEAKILFAILGLSLGGTTLFFGDGFFSDRLISHAFAQEEVFGF